LHTAFAALVAVCAALLAAWPAHAMKLKNTNLTQLIAQSESIIAGTVKSVTDGFDDDGVPYTEVTIAVMNAPKGPVARASEYTFRQFGLLKPRTMDNGKVFLGLTPEGFPRWREGESVVAFMYKPAARTGLQTTAGMAQGKLTLVNGLLFNDFNNAGLFDDVEIDAGLLTAEEQSLLTSQGAVDAGVFIDLVQRAVAEDWVGQGRMR
jgi:hypothetical protein